MKRSTYGWELGVALLALLAAAPMVSALGEEPSDKPAQKAGEKPAEKPAEKKDEVRVIAGPDGFVLQSGSDYRIRIGGYLQADGRFYAQDRDSVAANTFLLRRARPIFQGTVAKYFDFYLNTDFGQGQVVLYDAYLNVKTSSKLQLRVGKFKPPVGLERLQSAASILFVERALPTALAPNRDVGAQLHGELGGGVATYAVGVFDGAVDGALIDTDTNDGKDVAGRIFFQPFARGGSSALKGLGLGIAGSRGKQLGALPSFRTGGQIAFFTYLTTSTADGTRTRVAPQGSFYAGPVGLFGEWTRTRDLPPVAARTFSERLGPLDGRERHRDGRAPATLVRPRQGHLGRVGAGRPRERLRRRSRRVLGRICGSRALGAQGPGLGHRPQLVPEPELQVRRELRAHHVHRRRGGRQPPPRERHPRPVPGGFLGGMKK